MAALLNASVPSQRLGCCRDEDRKFGGPESKRPGRSRHSIRIPDPEMAPELARIYEVDVELGPGLEW